MEADQYAAQFSGSTETDPIWWGSEAKTQLKILRNCSKELASQMKGAGSMSEISSIGLAQKKLTVIVDIVEAAEKFGIDTDDFKKAHDVSVTYLQLEPVVHLSMLAHLTFAPHKMDRAVRGRGERVV